MATFGERMKQLRIESSQTLDELKLVFHTTKSTLSRYENNKGRPNTEFATMVANYFGVSTDYILGRTDDRKVNTIKGDNLPKELKEIDPDMAIQVIADDTGISPDDIKSIIKAAKDIKDRAENRKKE